MPPTLEQVFAVRAFISKDDTLNLGPTKGGQIRFAVPVTGGYIKGSGIDLEII